MLIYVKIKHIPSHALGGIINNTKWVNWCCARDWFVLFYLFTQLHSIKTLNIIVSKSQTIIQWVSALSLRSKLFVRYYSIYLFHRNFHFESLNSVMVYFAHGVSNPFNFELSRIKVIAILENQTFEVKVAIHG